MLAPADTCAALPRRGLKSPVETCCRYAAEKIDGRISGFQKAFLDLSHQLFPVYQLLTPEPAPPELFPDSLFPDAHPQSPPMRFGIFGPVSAATAGAHLKFRMCCRRRCRCPSEFSDANPQPLQIPVGNPRIRCAAPAGAHLEKGNTIRSHCGSLSRLLLTT